MQETSQPTKQTYTEAEAALALGISIQRLHALLDEYVFTDGHMRPDDMLLHTSSLLLLQFWLEGARKGKIIEMPRRH